uniref:Uncharacterized protein n=1 Tax=Cajanus cajan TaxID=3821 RepID=A0A151SGA5_CAJCA|nr:hypothetical protein KK1_024342 [Cajanus cajan]
MEDSENSNAGCGQGNVTVTPYYTPYPRQMSQKSGLQPVNIDFSPSSGGDSSVASVKEGAGSPSSSSSSPSDSEQESQIVDEEKTDHKSWKSENRSYDELLREFLKKEEALNVSNLKLKLSEEENRKLKIQIEKNEGQLKNALVELEVKEENVEYEKEQVLELQEKTSDLEKHISDCYKKITKLVAQLDLAEEQLKISNDEISRLKEELDSRSSGTEEKIQLGFKLEEYESRSNELENKSRQFDEEKLELEELLATKQMVLQGEISCLKEELDQRRLDVEAVNKEFDRHKQKYDMLMTERDEFNAKIDNLMAEASFRSNHIANMERKIFQLREQNVELISGSEATLSLVNELKLKVDDLEKEVTRQNAVISDRAEEKREAIRQLCFSIEHYRSGYKELLQAFAGHKRHAVRAS